MITYQTHQLNQNQMTTLKDNPDKQIPNTKDLCVKISSREVSVHMGINVNLPMALNSSKLTELKITCTRLKLVILSRKRGVVCMESDATSFIANQQTYPYSIHFVWATVKFFMRLDASFPPK